VPIAIVTTSGWTVCEGLDMYRVREFSNGVLGVRASMTGVKGLHSQQSFFFPGVLQYDPLTVTLRRDAASARAFAYGPGVHKAQMLRRREQNLADRTSFTRCRILRAEGTCMVETRSSGDSPSSATEHVGRGRVQHIGQCSCGAVKVSVEGEPMRVRVKQRSLR
jgi:hypothetical protein